MSPLSRVPSSPVYEQRFGEGGERTRRRALHSCGILLALVGAAACSGDDSATTTLDTAGSITIGTSITGASGASTTEATGTTGTTTGEAGSDSSTSDSSTSAGTTGETTTAGETDTGGIPGCDDNSCPMGQYCDEGTGDCTPGCDGDEDCTDPLVCDLGSNTCTGCTSDGQCSLGTICEGGSCVPGCNDQQPCQEGTTCCAGGCVDPLVDLENCGDCGVVCEPPANAEAVCEGSCMMGECADGFLDCDQNPNNGCETKGATCACEPGAEQSCYTGPQGTENVGECSSGTQVCNDQGTAWGPCEGEKKPADEICADGKDNNCDGDVDEDPDADNDGYSVCGGDCCDAVGPECLNPSLVNPGAFEVMGNMVDDDCDGTKDNPLPLCDQNLASNSASALDYAKAIDLCQFTTENPPQEDKIWGVISGGFSRSNGSGTPNSNARSIRTGFGSVISPEMGNHLAVLSTGHAADSSDSNPNYAPFQGGNDNNADAAVPGDWLAANGGNFPNAPGCPDPAGGTTGRDTIQLKLRVRAPTNANSFSVMMYFFSSEYPEWVCSPYNDFFVTLVDSVDPDNPNDKNIAIYKSGGQTWPVGVNLVSAADGLFTQCKSGAISCGYPPQKTYNGCDGNAELNGTGFHLTNPAPKFGGDPGYCGSNNQVGGGTGWLNMSGNVTPGETMEIRFTIWDTGDEWYDSLVLLDDWEWSVQASEPGVIPN